MGGDNDQASNSEFPKHKVTIDAFLMDETEVTNQDYLTFVQETGYVTVAERSVNWDELKKKQEEEIKDIFKNWKDGKFRKKSK